MTIPTFREIEDRVGRALKEQGGLGAILIDLAPLARIERNFGGATYQALRAQIDPLVLELPERFQEGELLARDERDGDRFFLFVSMRRPAGKAFQVADLSALADKIEEALTPRVARLTQPYTREPAILSVGYGVVLFSPLESSERQILRLIDDAASAAEMRTLTRQRREREALIEIIYNYEQNIWTAFQPIVAVGDRSALPHYRPGDCRLDAAPFVLVDWGAVTYGGYHSDLTRVLVTDNVPAKLQELHGLVLKAQLVGIAAIRPGAKLAEVDAVARRVIEEAGYGSFFGHGLGHGIGLHIHEDPRLNSIAEGELQPGNVVTVEPGIYLPDFGGVRIEDDVLVTPEGHEVLSSIPKDLV